MTIHRAAAYLTRFDDAPPPSSVRMGENDDAPTLAAILPLTPPEPPPEPQPSAEEVLAEAEARFAETLDAEREAFAARLREERERWTTEQAELLNQKVALAFEAAIRSIRADVARVLCPFVSQAIADRTADELVAALRDGLANENDAVVSINAPRDLLEKVEAAMKRDAITIAAQEADTVDARIVFASTIVETSLGDWIARLSSERSPET